MLRRIFKRAAIPSMSSLLHSQNLCYPNSVLIYKPPLFVSPPTLFVSKPFSSYPPTDREIDPAAEEDDNNDSFTIHSRPIKKLDPKVLGNVDIVMASLRNFDSDAAQAKYRLENCSVPVSQELVYEVLSRLRNEWGPAFTFFLWAGKQPDFSHSVHSYHIMIMILGKMKRFDTAWSLVDEMTRKSLVTPQTLLILIRKYCAIHEVAKAINVFYAFKKYGFKLGINEFHGLLSALCRYKNVTDAEHLLLCNESTFPFETKSFNIVLNGWCNVLVYVREAKRFWREMGNRGVDKDVVSYGSMISCYSKASNLNDVLKLFNQMKELGIVPDIKVYNALVYSLAKGKCINEAKNLLKTMEEKGVTPNSITYNSLIRPLCKARRLDEARLVFDEMLNRGLFPSTRTYHAFFDVFTTVDEIFDLLNQMKQAGCKPVSETYIMLIRKLSRWRQFESVFKLWDDMRESGVSPDRSAYIVLIHGLFLNGKLEDAFKFYEEMKAKGFDPEPKTEEMIQAWVSGK
ncbi:uncharacterized protein A4U43_C02F17640 [Asparagus officinalis]|uniref:Pentacotripeptide-repeat region of PRORP domain-containing protein n=1 Tax=Asparagus officinalis TaxID=4686 RepID=A0A5P1FJQ5_ASPOF|nr:pentatricopeptide repeat-containing protein At5g15010, mitochondrial-like [Asparagus officinalis]XP_020254519.1 pentatricopeptide repeat-containing protein At5g15010, mitochondrial-like [Asparagus officinalis]XP_020254520.1 pentatricopeptide repeat-containing protein At5g15010, mitochondrial-like [Asparagus officinalis]XP_020254521.1 pentatricopeptide repeat-containing protein At5g15010, mitochondrial-like [Asparagus officinalis]ONK78352.1 uncharacterized protein A4U43_C02F17640 [Asparagus o